MNSSKNIKIICGICVCVIISSLCFYAWKTQTKVRTTLLELHEEYNDSRFRLMDLKEKQYYSLLSEAYLLPEELDLFFVESGCLLRLHEGVCLGCYAESLARFLELMKMKNMSLGIWGAYATERQFRSELSNVVKLDSLKIINLKKDISLPADSLNQPYLFIKEGNRTSRVFVIEKDDYKSIEQYVEMLSRILNKIN